MNAAHYCFTALLQILDSLLSVLELFALMSSVLLSVFYRVQDAVLTVIQIAAFRNSQAMNQPMQHKA